VKELRPIVIYFLSIVLGGMLLAPPLYWIGQSVGSQLGIRVLVSSGFERYFNRAILITAVLGLWPLIKALEIRDRRRLGLMMGPRLRHHLLVGFGLAFGMVLVEWLILQVTGWYSVTGFQAWLTGTLPRIIGTAVVVSLIEEALFRGVLQSILSRILGWLGGWIIVAFLFAIIHFVKPPSFAVTGSEVAWWSGFALFPHFFWMFDLFPAQTWTGLASLTVVGLILGRAAMLTQGLALPIGLHAGWILGLESAKRLMPRETAFWPWISRDLLGGLIPFLLLLLTWGVVEFWMRRARPQNP